MLPIKVPFLPSIHQCKKVWGHCFFLSWKSGMLQHFKISGHEHQHQTCQRHVQKSSKMLNIRAKTMLLSMLFFVYVLCSSCGIELENALKSEKSQNLFFSETSLVHPTYEKFLVPGVTKNAMLEFYVIWPTLQHVYLMSTTFPAKILNCF